MAYSQKKFRVGDELTAAALNAMQDEIKRLGKVSVSGAMTMHDGAGGLAFAVPFAPEVKVAKVGSTAIPAMATLTPGSGDVTLYDMGATALVAQTVTTTKAYNTEFSPIEAGSWIKVVEVDGRWFVAESPRGHVAKNGASTIAAMSGTTPGSGTVTIYTFAGSTLTAGGAVTAYNMTSAAVAANRYLQIKRINGYWFVDVESCT